MPVMTHSPGQIAAAIKAKIESAYPGASRNVFVLNSPSDIVVMMGQHGEGVGIVYQGTPGKEQQGSVEFDHTFSVILFRSGYPNLDDETSLGTNEDGLLFDVADIWNALEDDRFEAELSNKVKDAQCVTILGTDSVRAWGDPDMRYNATCGVMVRYIVQEV